MIVGSNGLPPSTAFQTALSHHAAASPTLRASHLGHLSHCAFEVEHVGVVPHARHLPPLVLPRVRDDVVQAEHEQRHELERRTLQVD